MLTIKLACGHTAQRETPRDPGEAAAVVNDWRKRSCPDPECRPYGEEIKIAKNLTDEESRARKLSPVRVITGIGTYKAEPVHGAKFYHKHDGEACQVLQLDDSEYVPNQAPVLERYGFALMPGGLRAHWRTMLRGKTATTTTMALASTWIDANAELDHTSHVCPTCGIIMGDCEYLGCSKRESPYTCRECLVIAERERIAADLASRRVEGRCAERWCHANVAPGIDYCPSHEPAPVFEHCPEEGCATIVASKGDHCNYHATIEARVATPLVDPRVYVDDAAGRPMRSNHQPWEPLSEEDTPDLGVELDILNDDRVWLCVDGRVVPDGEKCPHCGRDEVRDVLQGDDDAPAPVAPWVETAAPMERVTVTGSFRQVTISPASWPPLIRARLAAYDELERLIAVQAATALVQQARARANALSTTREG